MTKGNGWDDEYTATMTDGSEITFSFWDLCSARSALGDPLPAHFGATAEVRFDLDESNDKRIIAADLVQQFKNK